MGELNPITREEIFMAAAAGENVPQLEPITRQEMFLHRIAKTVENIIPGSGGNVDQEQITAAINEALAQAKASGEFDGVPGKDGADGQPGKDGEDGYTPVKGVDYFDGQPGKDGAPGADGAPGYTPVKGTDYYTAADKAEMVNAVLSALPTWTGGSY